MGRPRALIIDDSEASRYILRHILESQCDVVGEAVNGLDAIVAAENLRPDLIVLDISMPVMGGFEAAPYIRRSLPDAHIVFASEHTTPMYAEEAFRIGAKGYVTKGAAVTELMAAVHEVLAGNCFRSPLTEPQRVH